MMVIPPKRETEMTSQILIHDMTTGYLSLTLTGGHIPTYARAHGFTMETEHEGDDQFIKLIDRNGQWAQTAQMVTAAEAAAIEINL
jgi:hypothetical protein